jgi:hypothetical protein
MTGRINRRDFLKFALAAPILMKYSTNMLIADDNHFNSDAVFDRLIFTAKKNHWEKLQIGELMGKLGKELLNTPYVGGTLEGDGPEICRVTFSGLDCVSFFENVLCTARVIKQRKSKFSDLIEAITYTRYRAGKLTDYTSRLHYTSDWIYDNILKGTVVDVSKQLGGEEYKFKLSFMSSNPKYYKPLISSEVLTKKMSEIENVINQRAYYIIPKNKIESIEKNIITGDIIAIATEKKGLDYSHTGLAYHSKGITSFMHASSKKKKVVIDKSISEYVFDIKSNIGITVLRPQLER